MSRQHEDSLVMHRISLWYGTVQINVSSDAKSDLDWLKEFLSPAFHLARHTPSAHVVEVSLRHNADVVAQVRATLVPHDDSPALLPAFIFDSHLETLPAHRDDTGAVWSYDALLNVVYHIDAAITVYSATTSLRDRRAALMRVVREVAMDVGWRSGSSILHASGFIADGKTILLAGSKRSGKTSLLSAVLTSVPGIAYLTNDRAWLSQEHRHTTVTGIPTLVSIRPGSQQIVPRLADRLSVLAHNAFGEGKTEPDAHAAEHPAHLVLSPRQFTDALGVPLYRDAPLHAIIHCSVSEQERSFTLRPLGAAEAHAQSVQALLGAAHIGTPSALFGVEAAGPFPSAEDLRARLHTAVTGTRAYALRMGLQMYDTATLQALLDLIM